MMRVRLAHKSYCSAASKSGTGTIGTTGTSSGLNQRAGRFAFPERFRGTFVERWKQYWESVAKDYCEATVGIGTYARQHPVRSAAAAAAAAFAYCCAAANPDERSYRAELLDCANAMLYISPAVRNPAAVQHLERLERCYNAGVVKRLNMLFFSVVWIDECGDALRAYKAGCKYLKPSVLSVPARAVDVGFMNVWWNLREIMVDYDVNPDEWRDYRGPPE